MTGPQAEELFEALIDAFDKTELSKLLDFRLDKEIRELEGKDFQETVYNTVSWARRNGKSWTLAEEAFAMNSNNNALTDFVHQHLRSVAQILDAGPRMVEVHRLRWLTSDAAARVCRIETTENVSTGFLISDDVVLTNYSTIAQLVDKDLSQWHLVFRFTDFHAATYANEKIHYPADKWLIAFSPSDELNYAAIRLKDAAALDIAEGKQRGFLRLSIQPVERKPGRDWVILHYARGTFLRASIVDYVGKIDDRQHRFGYDPNVAGGSQGGPCLDNDVVVAVHECHKTGSDNRKIGVGIMASEILTDMRRKHVDVHG